MTDSKVQYRRILIKDLDAIDILYEKATTDLGDPLQELRVNRKQRAREMRRLRQQLLAEQRYLVWLAHVEESIVGYVAAVLERQASIFQVDSYAVINELYVEESYRKQGIGTQLIEYLTAEVHDMGIEWLSVHLPGKAISLENFFNKLTFQIQVIEMRRQLSGEE